MDISTIGLDLAKNVFQVHAVDASGEVVIRKTLRRSQLQPFFEKLPPCLVGAEPMDCQRRSSLKSRSGPCSRTPSGPAVLADCANRPDRRLHPTERQTIN